MEYKKEDYLKKLELSRQLEGRVVFNVLLDRNFAVETEEKTYILLQENFPTRKISPARKLSGLPICLLTQ
jgi:hypothetical protein